MDPGFKDDWLAFMSKIVVRLDKGEAEYEGRSFSKSPDVLLDEIEEELLDVAGWSFIMWKRIKEIRAALEHLPKDAEASPTITDRVVNALETVATAVKDKISPFDYTIPYQPKDDAGDE